MTLEDDRLLTPKEAAGLISVSESTLLRWCRTGELKAVKVGKQWRVSAVQVQAIQQYGFKPYCTQNDGDCGTCSLVNYGRDCMNNPVDIDHVEDS